MMEKEWTMIIRPQEKLWKVNLREIWAYRDLIELFVKRNIITVYKQTLLGSLWYLIHEHGGVWWNCPHEYRWCASSIILSGR